MRFLAVVLAIVAAATGCSKPGPEGVATSTDNLGEGEGAGLVVSQVHGGTGAPGAVFTRDYVELFNRSSAPVSLARLSIQIGQSPASALPANVVVPAGGYFLVGFGAGGAGADLKVDAGGASVSIHPVRGKVALVGSSGTTIDVLVYENGARGKALLRKDAGCTQTTSNADDFEVAAPAPRSSKTTVHLCGAT